jgi:hypothetical protein
MNTLNIKYVSQIMTGALEHNNDCGSASSLMLLNTYNLANETTVDGFYNKIVPSGDIALNAGSMQVAMSSYGLKTDWKVDMTMAQCFENLRNKKPILALVHYGTLVDAGVTQKTGFRGAHFLVVTGIDLENIFVNDPYRDDGVTNVPVPHKTFEKAWADCTLDGNPQGGCVIPKLPIQDLSVPVPVNDEYYLIVNGLNLRSGPSGNFTLIRTIWKTSEPIIHVDASSLTNEYVQLTDKTGWVYFAYLKKK